ncbi:hypothetical protein HDU98_002758 [Podochytrium sp. JEL0797]|nr:hypothetical protein HDU98_002758 [Podochytrium sp. JEL0797]
MSMSAQDVAAVYPLVGQNTFFGIGETNAINWTNNVTNPLTAPIVAMQIVLGTGSTNQVQNLYPLATVAYPAATCYEWTPTANLTNPQYTLTFNGLDVKGATVSTNYVTWFKLAAAGSAEFPAATTCAGGSGQLVQDPVGASAVATSAAGAVATTGAVVSAATTGAAAAATSANVITKSSGVVAGVSGFLAAAISLIF